MGLPSRARARGRAPAKDMAWVPGGGFLMGSDEFYPEERPARRVEVVVHPEPVHLHPARGALLGVELVRPHLEAAPGHPRHILGRRPASGSGPGR